MANPCGNSGRYSREKFGKFLPRAALESKNDGFQVSWAHPTGIFFAALWTIFLHSSLPPIAAATSTDSAVHNATLSISLSSLVFHVPVDSQKFSVGFQFKRRPRLEKNDNFNLEQTLSVPSGSLFSVGQKFCDSDEILSSFIRRHLLLRRIRTIPCCL